MQTLKCTTYLKYTYVKIYNKLFTIKILVGKIYIMLYKK